MRKSTIPFLIINLFFAVSFTSCANRIVKGYIPVNIDKQTFDVPYFSNRETDYVYKANFSFYGREQSGIFIAKKINDSMHRVVFTTEFGNKILDFDISETLFKVNYILPELDKKILINILKTDFRLLLRPHYIVRRQFEDSGDNIYETREGGRYNYLFVSKSNGELHRMTHTTKRKEKIDISFTPENNIIANKIIIEHKNIKLKMELNYLRPDTNYSN